MRMIPVPARRLLFWAAAIFAFVMAVLPRPPELPGEPSDKIQHMFAFAVLASLGSWAFAGTALSRLLAALSAYGALIELVQGIPALGRDSDVKDWVADTVAAAAVLLLVGWLRTRSEKRPAP